MGEPVGGFGVGREKRIAEGVSIRSNAAGEPESIRISFMFRGVECRERLSLEPTVPNQRYAVRLRGEIQNAIARGTFNYADFFPESQNARRFGFVASGATVGNELRAWEAIAFRALAPSTQLTYRRVLDRYLYPWFDNVRLRDLTPQMIRSRVLEIEGRVDKATGKGKGVILKSAKNILTPLQAMLSLAVDDGKIASNPVGRMALGRHWPTAMLSSDWEADPCAWNELEAIFEACEGGPQGAEADYWRFAVGTGLRPSEQIALTWERCDLLNFRIKVAVARVTGPEGSATKGPKTKAGKRDVDLTAGAWEALQRQKARTFLANGPVFVDPRTGAEWRTEETLRKRWVRILRKAGVRYRNPYQTRHTFVSSLLAAGLPPLWVARQVGHATVEMLERNYGHWIDQGSSDRRQLIAFFSHASPTVQRQVAAFPLRR